MVQLVVGLFLCFYASVQKIFLAKAVMQRRGVVLETDI